MSTHTLVVAEEIADRIGIMNNGRLHFLGTVGELQSKLASRHDSLEPLFLELTNGERERKESEEVAKEKAEGEPS
jgi:ABC-2 type transport system ATP-binding protein